MTRIEFLEKLTGTRCHFTRTCLATLRVSDEVADIRPSGVFHHKMSSTIKVRMIHCYDDTGLFTEDYGVLVAVVRAGAGHIWCDRFVPIEITDG